MARWLSVRRREAAEGTLDPAYRDGLAHVPGWLGNRRDAEDEARWHHLEGRMRNYLDGLEQRNGTAYLELVAIALARFHFKSLDDLARATGAGTGGLLDAVEVEALEGA